MIVSGMKFIPLFFAVSVGQVLTPDAVRIETPIAFRLASVKGHWTDDMSLKDVKEPSYSTF